MARLRNAVTGVVVSVADEKADRLGKGWVAIDSQPEPEPEPAVPAEPEGDGEPAGDPQPEPEPEKPARGSRYRK